MINLQSSIVDPNTQAASAFWSRCQLEYGNLTRLLADGQKLIWKNPAKLTPQQAANLFGTNAVGLFAASAALAMLIGTINGTTPTVMPAGWTYTANSDGSVTLTPPAT